jgi:hypothetical protein
VLPHLFSCFAVTTDAALCGLCSCRDLEIYSAMETCYVPSNTRKRSSGCAQLVMIQRGAATRGVQDVRGFTFISNYIELSVWFCVSAVFGSCTRG